MAGVWASAPPPHLSQPPLVESLGDMGGTELILVLSRPLGKEPGLQRPLHSLSVTMAFSSPSLASAPRSCKVASEFSGPFSDLMFPVSSWCPLPHIHPHTGSTHAQICLPALCQAKAQALRASWSPQEVLAGAAPGLWGPRTKSVLAQVL